MKKLFASLLLAAALPFAAAQEPDTVVDIAAGNDDFSTLVAAVTEAGLVETLSGEGPFTVFAPTDAAFADALEALGLTAEELLASEDLGSILTYHVVAGDVLAADLIELAGEDGMVSVETVQGSEIEVMVSADGVVLNGSANVVTTDLEAGNGVVHVIDAVLLPPAEEEMGGMGEEESMMPATVVDIAAGNEDFSILVAAVMEAGLVETLSGEGPFTVFAPTNAAFADALEALGLTAEELLASEDLGSILTYHVVPGYVLAADVVELAGDDGMVSVETVQGAEIDIMVSEDGVMLNDTATVVTTDLEAGNGVVHVIDAVLLPPSDGM